MRTETDILAEMEATLATLEATQKPTSTSEVGVFVWLKKAWALLAMDIERRTDSKLTEIKQAVDTRPVGSLAWHAQQVKLFQFGDAVGVYGGGVVGYAVTDPARQIVKQASATEENGRVLIKVAKQTTLTVLAPLTETELNAVRAYVNQFKFAGVGVDVVSRAADSLKITATVAIDPQILSVGANGASLTDAARKPVELALKQYLRELPFDSVVSWTAITDYMQAVPGVNDFLISATALQPDGATGFIAFNREALSLAGHLILSPDSLLTYV